VIILLGILVMMLINYRPKIQPSLVSRVTTVFQVLTIIIVLMVEYGSFFSQLSTIAIYGTALFTILSGAHYICIGTRILNEKK